MATGRTHIKHCRFYISGLDVSGVARQFGPLVWQYDESDLTGIDNAGKGYLPEMADITPTVLNSVMDTAYLLWDNSSGAGTTPDIMIPFGIRTAPAEGDPVFVGRFNNVSETNEGDTGVYLSAKLGAMDASGQLLGTGYDNPWGLLLHEKSAETAVNTAVAVIDHGSSTSSGGFFTWQVFAGDGTATIKMQDASTNTNPSFSDVSGATSGVIDCSAATSGWAALSKTATIERYIRWQIVLGTATTVTFASAFVREARNFT